MKHTDQRNKSMLPNNIKPTLNYNKGKKKDKNPIQRKF